MLLLEHMKMNQLLAEIQGIKGSKNCVGVHNSKNFVAVQKGQN